LFFQKIRSKRYDKTSDFVDYLTTIHINLMSECEELPSLHMDEQYEIKVNCWNVDGIRNLHFTSKNCY